MDGLENVNLLRFGHTLSVDYMDGTVIEDLIRKKFLLMPTVVWRPIDTEVLLEHTPDQIAVF